MRPPSKQVTRVGAPAGFTLLELILVMAIIAIIVGLSVPSLHGFAQGRRTSACADQIAALAHYAHTQAITRATVYRLNIKPAAMNQPAMYWLTVQAEDGTFVPTGDTMGLQYPAPDGADISWNAPQQADGQYIQFMPTGRSDVATIVVRGADRQVIYIACPSATELYKVMSIDEARSLGIAL
jgi:prepilin-type N-terminal cleavage/methylation domain-containing protein